MLTEYLRELAIMRHIRSHQCCSTETRAVVKSTPGATSFYGRPLGEAVGPPWVPARSRSWPPFEAEAGQRGSKKTEAETGQRRRAATRPPSFHCGTRCAICRGLRHRLKTEHSLIGSNIALRASCVVAQEHSSSFGSRTIPL